MNEQDDALYKILSWRDSFKSFNPPPKDTYRIRRTSSIVGDDNAEWGSKFQGIFVDVDWSAVGIE